MLKIVNSVPKPNIPFPKQEDNKAEQVEPKSSTRSAAVMTAISCAREFWSVMQNLYSSIGTTPIIEQAKKPFRMLRAVVFMFALPHWYSIATSKIATTKPAAKSD